MVARWLRCHDDGDQGKQPETPKFLTMVHDFTVPAWCSTTNNICANVATRLRDPNESTNVQNTYIWSSPLAFFEP